MDDCNRDMRIIVAGATSCIGSAVVRQLLQRGYNVVAVMRQRSSRRTLFERELAGVDTRRLRVRHFDFSQYGQLNDEADAFINFAWGGTTGQSRNDVSLQQHNVYNELIALAHAKELGCKVYIDAGSQAEYGWQDGTLTDESMPCDPFSQYGRAKLDCWLRGADIADRVGLTYIHTRIFSVYGETESDQAIVPYCINQIIGGQPVSLTECSQSWNFLYRYDAANIFCDLMEHHISKPATQQIYNVASRDTRILKDYILEIKDIIGRDATLEFGAKQADKLLSLSPSVDKLLSVIGDFKFTPFSAGIKRETEYLSQYKS